MRKRPVIEQNTEFKDDTIYKMWNSFAIEENELQFVGWHMFEILSPGLYILFVKHKSFLNIIELFEEPLLAATKNNIIKLGYVGDLIFGGVRVIIFCDAFVQREELKFLPEDVNLFKFPDPKENSVETNDPLVPGSITV
jgi:hypothetical protein